MAPTRLGLATTRRIRPSHKREVPGVKTTSIHGGRLGLPRLESLHQIFFSIDVCRLEQVQLGCQLVQAGANIRTGRRGRHRNSPNFHWQLGVSSTEGGIRRTARNSAGVGVNFSPSAHFPIGNSNGQILVLDSPMPVWVGDFSSSCHAPKRRAKHR